MIKRLSKVITFVVLVAFLFSTIHQNAYAEMAKPFASQNNTAEEQLVSLGKDDGKQYVMPESVGQPQPEPQILEEDTSKRDRFSKEFIRSDSSRLLVLYPQAVHYQEDGKWEEVDNTLVSEQDESGKETLKNKAGRMQVKLPKTYSPENEIEIVKDGYVLKFKLDGEYKGAESILDENNTKQLSRLTDNQKKTIPTKWESALTYTEILPNTDFKYNLEPEALKESIVVKQLPESPLAYTFSIYADQLEPVMQQDNSIHFYAKDKEEKEPVFVMPAPYMIDDKGEVNYEVKLTIDVKDEGCKITYEPSMEWLQDPKRAYPIVIDPVVTASLDIDNIKDQQVDSLKNDVSYTSSYIECGKHTTYGIERIYMMYQSLPALKSADVIVDASIQIYRPYNSTVVSQMQVHKVNATWNVTTLQWSNKPAFNTSVEDVQTVQNIGWYTWSITDIARGWYAGSNTGMMFKLPDSVENGSTSHNKTFYSSDNGTGYRPILTIAYRNNSGLEGYWNYHTQEVGRAGTGYVNDYTGNLVFVRDDIGIDGNIMPVSIKHIYNANDKSTNPYGCGYGWRTNYNQKVYQEASYYVWEDDDGTKHYFKYSSANTYKDEDGLFLTLKNNETGNYLFSITDKVGNKRFFDSQGRLARIQNNQPSPSMIDIDFVNSTSPKINHIYDGVDRQYAFIYSGADLIAIRYKGTGTTTLQEIGFAYNANSELSTVTYFDSETTTYGYTTNHLLNRATDIDGYYVSYSYNSTSTSVPNRVTSLAYYDNAVAGDTLSMMYSHNETTFTDYRGRKIVEQFNNMGNTTSIQDDQGNAQYAQYAKDDDGDTGVANQLTVSSKLQNTVTNYIKNGSAEYTDGWALVTTGSPAGSWSYSTAAKYVGTKSVAIARTNEAGTYAVSQPLTLTKGKTYTFSAWVKTASMSNTGDGTYLAIENDGVNTAQSEIIKTTTSSSDPNTDSNGWRRVEATLTIPTSASSSTVTFSMYQGTIGTAYYDCLQVEEAPTASRYNLVENSDFTYQGTTSSDALYWTESSTTTSDLRTTISPSGCARLNTNCFKITGEPATSKNIWQSINISGAAHDVFSVGGWAKGDSVPLSSGRYMALDLMIHYTDGTSGWFVFQFNPNANGWQYASGRATAAKAYDYIRIYGLFYKNVNAVYFDGMQVYREEFGTSYSYDANGNVINVGSINNGGTQNNRVTSFTYTNNNPTAVTDTRGYTTTNGFDSYHNQTSVTTTNEKRATTYATNGNVAAETQVDPDDASAPTIEDTTTYTTDGNYVATTIDESRHTTSYGYNAQLGTLDWLQTPNDTTSTRTSYSYNTMNRMTDVAKPVSGLYNGVAQMSNSYTYEDDQIKTVSHNNTTSGNDTTYTFNYGDMRTLTSVQVGSGTPRTLVTNTYNSSDRSYNLTRATYGNNQWVNYTYNDGRITGIKFNNDSVDRFNIMYNNAGGIGSLTDNSNNLFTKYLYDMADNLQSVLETGINGRTYSHYYAWGYDDNRNVTSFQEMLNGSSWQTNYQYDEDNRQTFTTFGYGSRTSKISWIYDDYGRVSERNVFDNNTTQIFDTLCTFVNPDATHTSNLVATIRNKLHTSGGYDKTLTYQYDDNCNITSISDGTYTTSYKYDDANQLIRENNQAAGNTWTWTYDAGGNIRERRQYNYTADEDLSGKTYVSTAYGYTDANGWGDLLTSYNGNAITYDGLGNPESDGTWTYSWEGGRNLIGLSKPGTAVSYTYNNDGIRTSKTINGVTTEYTLVSGRVTNESNGINSIYYRYDNNNKVMSMNLNGAEYYYFRNAQNDIMGLSDNAGNVVVEYTYDAWGNILTITGSLADTVGVQNPYRYRGYIFDSESGLYYLQSRYYSPKWGRFINFDNYIFTEELNLAAYCSNNPVMYVDYSGHKKVTYVKPWEVDYYANMWTKGANRCKKIGTWAYPIIGVAAAAYLAATLGLSVAAGVLCIAAMNYLVEGADDTLAVVRKMKRLHKQNPDRTLKVVWSWWFPRTVEVYHGTGSW